MQIFPFQRSLRSNTDKFREQLLFPPQNQRKEKLFVFIDRTVFPLIYENQREIKILFEIAD